MNPLLLGILALGGFMVFAQMQPEQPKQPKQLPSGRSGEGGEWWAGAPTKPFIYEPYRGPEPDPIDPTRMYDASY
jgi:hypothetical protein